MGTLNVLMVLLGIQVSLVALVVLVTRTPLEAHQERLALLRRLYPWATWEAVDFHTWANGRGGPPWAWAWSWTVRPDLPWDLASRHDAAGLVDADASLWAITRGGDGVVLRRAQAMAEPGAVEAQVAAVPLRRHPGTVVVDRVVLSYPLLPGDPEKVERRLSSPRTLIRPCFPCPRRQTRSGPRS